MAHSRKYLAPFCVSWWLAGCFGRTKTAASQIKETVVPNWILDYRCSQLQCSCLDIFSFRQLTHVALFWNQRATRLWTLERTPLLRGLHFDDFTKLQDLTDLAAASSLEDLAFGNANWSKFVVPSLEPLSGLSHLQSLAFRVKAVIDNKIQPLANLTHLAELSFSANLFTTSQLAWLRAHLPATVSATVLAPYQQLRQPLTTRGKKLDVLISGKGKPFLSSETDSVKLSRYITEFNKMVLQFSDNAQLEP